jgi:hypothetical protein
MDDFNSETDSDYTSYWRDWVSFNIFHMLCAPRALVFGGKNDRDPDEGGKASKEVNICTCAFSSDICEPHA